MEPEEKTMDFSKACIPSERWLDQKREETSYLHKKTKSSPIISSILWIYTTAEQYVSAGVLYSGK